MPVRNWLAEVGRRDGTITGLSVGLAVTWQGHPDIQPLVWTSLSPGMRNRAPRGPVVGLEPSAANRQIWKVFEMALPSAPHSANGVAVLLVNNA